jgi:hypothetical protein
MGHSLRNTGIALITPRGDTPHYNTTKKQLPLGKYSKEVPMATLIGAHDTVYISGTHKSTVSFMIA